MSRTGQPSPEEIATTLLALAAERGQGKTICPSEVARALGGPHPDGWGPLMQPVRRVAVRLMKEGRIAILRKGRPVDPDDFRGVYRIALSEPSPHGAGNTSSV
jgi:hypothetical protein